MKYVCADIHGCCDRFMKMLEVLNFNDTDELYILGDVIDRNSGSIELLRYIMKHKKNIHLILGNHEKMMLDYLNTQRRNRELGLREDIEDEDEIWFAPSNGGKVTYEEYKKLDKRTQTQIYNYLSKLPLILLLTEQGQKYHLSHSGTLTNVLEKPCWYLTDCTEKEKIRIVWKSCYRVDLYLPFSEYPEDYICIFGHVPVQTIHDNWDKVVVEKCYNTVDVDGGCAYYAENGATTAISVYTLGTDNIQYVV